MEQVCDAGIALALARAGGWSPCHLEVLPGAPRFGPGGSLCSLCAPITIAAPRDGSPY
jgi:hypothetical protein